MKCRKTPEQKSVTEALSSQAYNVLKQALDSAIVMIKHADVNDCVRTRAVIQALLAHLFRMTVAHRRAHDEQVDLNPQALTMKEIREQPEVLERLVGDLSEELASILRESDPNHDYILDLLKVDRGGKP